ncbi:EexN family lipoprotein [Vibrio sp. CUB2]|uniref:EexN family lipoprotein n=1 Tax=Vibrio TaxID=662 RepID=UPI00076A3CA6|nr:EexN family lipoprotein [Vibrio sp. CUB2]CAH1607769.1 conserved hypothetical protein [Vibrio jasicida]
MKKVTLITLLSVALLGCDKEEVMTVEWYKSHDKERAELLKECKNNAEKAETTNCKNASIAQSKLNTNDLLFGDGISIKK